MHTHAERPAGPDFLAAFAEQNLAQGLLENAAEFRVRAAEWQRDQARLEQQANTIATLQESLRRIQAGSARSVA